MKVLFSSLGRFLDGKKTYIFIVLLFVMFMLDMKGWIPAEMQPHKEEIYGFLLAGAGISLRMGMTADNKKLEKSILADTKKTQMVLTKEIKKEKV